MSFEIQSIKGDEIPLFGTVGIHWILGEAHRLGTFGGTYLEAQMELEGVLGL